MAKDPSQSSDLVKIGEASKILGVHIDTLRRWEKSGKITPVRTPGGTRLYSLTELWSINPKAPESFSQSFSQAPSTQELLDKKAAENSSFSYLLQDFVEEDKPTQIPDRLPEHKRKLYKTIAESQTNLTKPGKPSKHLLNASILTLSVIVIATSVGILTPLIPLPSQIDIPSIRIPKINLAERLGGMIPHLPAEKKLPDLTQIPESENVLAATSIAKEGKYLEFNADTVIRGDLAVDGAGTFTGNVTAPNLLSKLTAGSGISVTTGNSPTIASTDTLALVTGRGATTTSNLSLSGLVNLGNVLNMGNLSSDPSSASKGATYYNTTSNKFRCYISTSWSDCDTSGSSGMTSFTLAGTSGTSQTISDGTTLTIAAGNGITTTAASTRTVTVGLGVTTTSTTTTTTGNSGLEATTTGLRLLGGCSDTQVLVWDATNVYWKCGSGGSSFSGTANKITKFATSTTLGDSSISDTGSVITLTPTATTGTTTSSGAVINASSLTSGTALYLTSSATSGKLLDLNATETSGTISNLAYGSSTTLGGTLIGKAIDLGTNVTATNQTVTGTTITLPTPTDTHTSGTKTLTGTLVTFGTGSGINQNGAGGTLTYIGGDFRMPALTLTQGTALNAYGLEVTTPSTFSGSATAYGLYVNATGAGSGTLNGVFIGGITAGNGTEDAISVGAGWDSVLKVGSTTVINGSGVTQVAGGGTGAATFTANGVLYGNTASTLQVTAAGTTGQVLIGNTSSAPSWGTISGSTCSDCILTDPSSSQTIAPTGQATTGLIVKQTSTGSPSGDIFDICASANCTGSNKFFSVDSSGNVSTGAISNTTLTLTPTSDTTALTLVGTNVSSQALQYINSKNASATSGIVNLAYGAAQTLTGSVIGIRQDLSTNVTATNQSVTGVSVTLPTASNTSGTENYKGLVVSSGALTNLTGTTTFIGADITMPATITQSSGTLNAYGAKITTPTTITTAGTAYGVYVNAAGVGSGGVLYGMELGGITAGAGTEYALNIGTGWDRDINFENSSTVITIPTSGTLTFKNAGGTSLCTLTDSSSVGTFSCGSSGAQGYWSRSSTTISPATSNDLVSVSSNTTTGTVLALTASALTTGNGLSLTNTFAGSGVTAYGINNASTDSTGNANTDYGNYTTLALTGNAGKVGFGTYSSVTNTSTTAATEYAGYFRLSDTGIVTSGTDNSYGLFSTATRTGSTTAGTYNTYAGYFTTTADDGGAGTTNAYGIYAATTAGDNNYGLAIAAISTANTANQGINIGALSGATTSKGIVIGALSSATSAGIDIGALSGSTANRGIAIGAITAAATANNFGVDIGAITPQASATVASINTSGIAAGAGTATYGIKLGTNASTATSNYGMDIGAMSGAATTNTAINIGNISAATGNNYGMLIGTLGGGTGASVYGIASGALTSVASGTNYQASFGTIAGASSATFGGVNIGAISGAGTQSAGVVVGANTATATTNYGMTIGAISGAGTTNYGVAIGALSGATTSKGIIIGALSSATSAGIDIGALSGSTANRGIAIGAITAAATANNFGVDIGAITPQASATVASLNTSGIAAGAGTATYGIKLGTNASTATSNYGMDIGAMSGAATTNVAINIGNISAATGNNYGMLIGTLGGGTGASVYGISSGTLTSVASGTNYQLNLGAVAGASSATFGAIATGALSGAGTASYGINLGANTSTATTNYGMNVGAISGAGTTNTGLNIAAISGSTNNYAIKTAQGSVDLTDNSNTVGSLVLTNNTATTIGNGVNTLGVMDLQSTSLTTGTFMNIEVNALTTGKGINLTSTTTLTSGQMFNISNTSTALTSGSLIAMDWTPGSAVTNTATGDLFKLTIGANGANNPVNFLNFYAGSSSLFSVSQQQITTSLPANFTAAGDVSIAYDIQMTNPTASFIKSQAPLHISAGELFNSSNLVLQTYNFGAVVLDSVVTTSSTAATKYNLYINGGDTTSTGDTLYGIYATIPLTGNAAKTAFGNYNTMSTTSTTADTIYGSYNTISRTANAGASMYGYYATLASSSTTSTDKLYGGYFTTSSTGVVAKTSNFGIYTAANSTSTTGDTTYGLYSTTVQSGATSGTLTSYGLESIPTATGVNTGTVNLYGTYNALSSIAGSTATLNAYGEYIANTAKVTGAGIVNSYGLYVANGTMDTTGTSTQYGIYVAHQKGADTNADIGLQASAAFTQASALTGMSLDFNTNYTGATGANLTGIIMANPPNLTITSTTTYTGIELGTTSGAYTTNGANFTYSGIKTTTPNLTQTANVATANGENITIGTLTTGGTQNGILITPPSTTNSGGTTNGINIGTISTSNGTDNAITISTGWDKQINANQFAVDGVGVLTLNLANTSSNGVCHTNSGTGTAEVLLDCTGTITDYAEVYPTAGNNEPGDILVTTAGSGLDKSDSIYQNNVIGVISTNPNDPIGQTFTPSQNPVPVGLAGRVPIKVSLENGPIKKGDLLTTSSTQGVAMKATSSGTTIGTALEDYDGSVRVSADTLSQENHRLTDHADYPIYHSDPNQWPAGVGKISVLARVAFADPTNALANLMLDSAGNLVIPKLKVNQLTLPNNLQIDLANTNFTVGSQPIDLIAKLSVVDSLQLAVNSLQTDVATASAAIATQSAQIAGVQTNVASQQSALDSLRSSIASLSASLTTPTASPSANVAQLNLTPPSILLATGSATLSDLKVTDTLSSDKLLTALDATVSGVFKALGTVGLGSTTIAGDLVVDGTYSVTGGNAVNALPTLYLQNNALAQNLDIFNGKVTIDNTGKLVAQTVTAENYQVIQGKTTGSGKIVAGQHEIAIFNDKVGQNSRILITPTSPTSLTLSVTTKVPGSGFVVGAAVPTTSDITFDYWIINEVAGVSP